LTKLKHKGILNLTAVIIAVMLTNLAAVAESVLPYVAVSLYPEQVYLQDSSTTISGNALQIGCPEDISTYTDINQCTAEISNGLNVYSYFRNNGFAYLENDGCNKESITFHRNQPN
jgi:hypothetical protein